MSRTKPTAAMRRMRSRQDHRGDAEKRRRRVCASHAPCFPEAMLTTDVKTPTPTYGAQRHRLQQAVAVAE